MLHCYTIRGAIEFLKKLSEWQEAFSVLKRVVSRSPGRCHLSTDLIEVKRPGRVLRWDCAPIGRITVEQGGSEEKVAGWMELRVRVAFLAWDMQLTA